MTESIFFESRRDVRDRDLFLVESDGSSLRQLTANSVYDGTGGWSPDRSRLVFASSRRNVAPDLFLMDSDGSNVVRLTATFRAQDDLASWSPAGDRIVFWSNLGRDGATCCFSAVWTVRPDGSQRTRLTDDGQSWTPRWSPSGAHIVFVSFRDGDAEIFVMDANGGNQTQLTFNDVEDLRPDWSPDGRKLVFASQLDLGQNPEGDFELFTAEIDPADPTALTAIAQLTVNATFETNPTWSPDGQMIAFEGLGDDKDIFVMRAEPGAAAVNITNAPGADTNPIWHR